MADEPDIVGSLIDPAYFQSTENIIVESKLIYSESATGLRKAFKRVLICVLTTC